MKRFLLTLLLSILMLGSYAQIQSVNLRKIDGTSVCTDTLNNGDKPFAICFFASWCKPCNRELDSISEVYDDWVEETGLKVYAVSIDEGQNTQKVKPFVDAHQWPFEVLLDPNSDFRRAMGISMIPHTLIFDGHGNLVNSHSGYTDGSEWIIYETAKALE